MVARRAIVLALAAWLAGACSVDRSILTSHPYTCSNDGDCIDSYACVRGPSVDRSENFCGPRQGDGSCLSTFEGACLAACDPTVADSCANDFQCLRSQLSIDPEPNVGACVGFETCQTDAECAGRVGGTPRCLSTLVPPLTGGGGTVRAEGLTCVQAGCLDGVPCDVGLLCMASELVTTFGFTRAQVTAFDFCVPQCGTGGECPPNYSCLAPLEDVLPTPLRVCFPAFPGGSCRDDLNCLWGACHPVAGRDASLCTIECPGGQADCEPLNRAQPTQTDAYVCEPPAVGAGAICVPYRPHFYQCDPFGPGNTPCEPNATCVELTAGSAYYLCSAACTTDAMCPGYTLRHPRAGCPDIGGACGDCPFLDLPCLPKGLRGAPCCRNAQCRSDVCTGLRCMCVTDCDCEAGTCEVASGLCRCTSAADCNGGTCDLAGNCRCTAGAQCQSGTCNAGGRCACANDSECPIGTCSFGLCS